MSKLSILCRFCAQERPLYSTIDLKSDENSRQSVFIKLSLFGEFFVDFNNKSLPENVCITCFELLDKSYKFFSKVKESQEVLIRLCGEMKFDNVSVVKDEFDAFDFDDSERALKHSDSDSEETQTWLTYPWRCPRCDTVLSSMGALREHSKEAHGVCVRFQCADCEETTEGFDDFVTHVRGHRRTLVKHCEHCNIKMESTHNHATNHRCTFCGEIFDNEISLICHLNRFVTISPLNIKYRDKKIQLWSEYPTICKFCKIKVLHSEILKDHCLMLHGTCFGMKCVDCDNTKSDTFEDFVRHVKNHRPYLRNICHYCDSNVGELTETHISTHTGRHKCKLCGEIFSTKQDLQSHESKLSPSLIKTHVKRRKGPIKDKDCVCNVCGKRMKSLNSLRAHQETHKERKRNYTCDRCGKTFYTKNSLESHHKIHIETPKELCIICNKSFLNLQRLRKHVKTHNLEMPFQCDNCKKCFSSKDPLRAHMTVHMGLMPYKCQYCTKKFRYKNILKHHEYQHTGVRPYGCQHCQLKFASWSNCDKHMRRIHQTTIAKNVMTPHGKLAINPETGKPGELSMTSVVQEWTQMILAKPMGNKNKQVEQTSA